MREKSIYMSDLFMEKVWRGYERTLKQNRTRSNYFSAVCGICDFTKTDFPDITRNQANAYFFYREWNSDKPAISAKTMHSWLSVYRGVGRFIERELKNEPVFMDYRSPFEGLCLNNGYTDDIKAINLPTEQELDRIMYAAKMDADDQMYLIMLFVTKCAMTSGEILSLTPQRIKEDAAGRGFVVFREKNHQERIVKIPAGIMTYLYDHREKYGARERLFLNKNGDPLSERSLQKHVKKLMEKAEIEHPYTIQDLRNLSIAKMLYLGASEEDTAEYVGVQQRWMYRYSRVIPELIYAPCDRL